MSGLKRCKTCQWYAPEIRDGTPVDEGECRRHAPKPLMMVAMVGAFKDRLAKWPIVREDSFCGDHQ